MNVQVTDSPRYEIILFWSFFDHNSLVSEVLYLYGKTTNFSLISPTMTTCL